VQLQTGGRSMSPRIALAVLLLAALASPVHAQNPDFLFGKPKGAVAFRSGWFFARAGSDLYTFVQNQLTVDRKDFNAPALIFEVDVPVRGQLSAVAGFEFNGSSTNSEYRNFVDNNRLPITQTTELRELNLSYGVKFALTPPGREISPHAWIPSAVTPYVGAAGGAMWYKFHQEGDFVDFADFSVFPKTYDSRGWAPSAHAFAGVDIKLLRRLYLNAEARYLWSRATLDRAFTGFDPIDLTGTKVTGGIRYLF
jgi:hypothetical protein